MEERREKSNFFPALKTNMITLYYRNASNKRPGANLIFGALRRALIRGGGRLYEGGGGALI